MDSSFIDQVADEDEGYDPANELAYMTGVTDRCMINDPFASVEELKPFLRDSAAIDVPFLRKPAMMSAGCQSMKLLSIFPHSLS